jgi:hypothetical protein
MRNKTELTEANREYATAYAAHYTERDLPAAMRLYKQVMASHPNDPEAEYSRVQSTCPVNPSLGAGGRLEPSRHRRFQGACHGTEFVIGECLA